jgi:hypothetical protein
MWLMKLKQLDWLDVIYSGLQSTNVYKISTFKTDRISSFGALAQVLQSNQVEVY